MSGKTKAVRDEESKRKYTRHSDNKQNSLMFAINYLQFANTLWVVSNKKWSWALNK